MRGADASPNIYSVIETETRRGLEPFAYLRHVLTQFPSASTLDEVDALLPHRVDPARFQDASQFSVVS